METSGISGCGFDRVGAVPVMRRELVARRPDDFRGRGASAPDRANLYLPFHKSRDTTGSEDIITRFVLGMKLFLRLPAILFQFRSCVRQRPSGIRDVRILQFLHPR